VANAGRLPYLAHCRSLVGLLVVQTLLVLVASQPMRAEATADADRRGTVALQCRLGGGTWQPCQMQVERVGSHWWLLIGGQRLEFRHDGRGQVTMQQGNGDWRQVDSRWGEDASLCWNGVCAKGNIPLD
jgi:hypothetical protein